MFGIRKEAKLDRFGEQAYAVVYFGFTSLWGIVSGSYLYQNMILNKLDSILCHNYQRGGITRNTSGLVSRLPVLSRALLIVSEYRLPSLADDPRNKTVLSHASSILVPATARSGSWS